MKIESLPWDSEFFGMKVGFISTLCIHGEWEAPPDMKAFDLVYLLINCSSGCCSNLTGAQLYNAGSKLTFEHTIQKQHRIEILPRSIALLTDTSVELQELALLSGHKSRYRLDPRFPNTEFERLYRRWIDATIDGLWNAKVFGHFNGDRLTGFVTVEATSRYRIGLIAVAEDHQGKGIGKMLISAALAQAAKDTTPSLSVSTQGDNKPAQHAYLNSGFRLTSSIAQYHWWNPNYPTAIK